MKGVINKIIPFSNVDGPGNRLSIFFQGCNYDCIYCHNPETIEIFNENSKQNVSENISEMDQQIDGFLKKLSTRSYDALALIKIVSWEGTEHFEQLMPERILMSARLILEDSAKKNIEMIKERLRSK